MELSLLWNGGPFPVVKMRQHSVASSDLQSLWSGCPELGACRLLLADGRCLDAEARATPGDIDFQCHQLI